ncbi:MAG: hypothetical protein GTO54_08010, partial [Nitrososphaeria archaeon]|nr:hypothetical protein [Nitrososphaeria archaeon]
MAYMTAWTGKGRISMSANIKAREGRITRIFRGPTMDWALLTFSEKAA